MSDERCDFSDLPKDQCEHCNPAPAAVLEQNDKPLLADAVVIARENGKCPVCDEKIIANVDHISKALDGDYSGAWIHYGCGR